MANLESTQSSADVLADDAGPSRSDSLEQESTSADSSFGDGEDGANDVMDVQSDDIGDTSDEMLGDGDNGDGKRVKVYELRDQAWFDRGTGRCKGIYDAQNDVALLVVEPEQLGNGMEGSGGYVADEFLLNCHVSKDENYTKQQDTLIVWTDRQLHLDIALSFQDPDGCDDIWQFILEVQKHLSNQIDEPKLAMGPETPTISPLLSASVMAVRSDWPPPSLGNIKDQEMTFRMQAKSTAGRERAVEHIIGEDYIKQLIGVLNQAEDLESISDLHALCSLMQTILMFNDNGIFEYILQDDIFTGVLGMLEYDPEFPQLKASYRSFFRQFSKFRQVVEINDEGIRNKIHQTSRLMYLKDVVLARMLDDPTFNILNSFVFFNQVDITTYIQSDEELLKSLFVDFKDALDDPAKAEKRRDLVQFLHQLMLMGKGVQVPNRLQLYRTLLDRGLLLACEWAFRQPEATILHAGAEILTLAVEHDANAVRVHVVRAGEMQRHPTLLLIIIGLIHSTSDQGLVQQLVESLKTLLEPVSENEPQTFGRVKDAPMTDSFIQHFYDYCVTPLYEPLTEIPPYKDQEYPLDVPAERVSLFHTLVDMLSYCLRVHLPRGHYFLLSNTLPQNMCSLLYARDKTLRHAALRLFKAAFRSNNHFLHRNLAKSSVIKAILDLAERETDRDTMLSSACVDTLELIRRENMKAIICEMFGKHEPLMARLAERPFVRSCVLGLRVRWEQYQEQASEPTVQAIESNQTKTAAEEEEDWFNRSDEEGGASPATRSLLPAKRKRQPARKQLASPKNSGALGLDYDDASDSEGSVEGDSPRPTTTSISETNQLVDDLTDVELKIRAKRQRAEQEDEDGALAGLVGKGGAGGKKGDDMSSGQPSGGGGNAKEKKIRLSLGGLAKKLNKT